MEILDFPSPLLSLSQAVGSVIELSDKIINGEIMVSDALMLIVCSFKAVGTR